MFWVNPWFVLHGAWQGFWDGPHTLMALLAIYMLKTDENVQRGFAWACYSESLRFSNRRGWCSSSFQQQPIFFWIHTLWQEDVVYPMMLGALIVFLAALGLTLASGGTLLWFPELSALTQIMPNLSNESLNIWRTITRLIQAATGQSGPSYTLVLGGQTYSFLHLMATAVTAGNRGRLHIGMREKNRTTLGRCSAQDGFVLPAFRLGLAAFLVGLLRRSQTADNLIFNRYSPVWASMLGIGFLAGVAGLFFGQRIAQALTANAAAHLCYRQIVPVGISQQPYAEAHILLFVLALCSILFRNSALECTSIMHMRDLCC